MHSDVVISVKDLTKTYRIFGHPGDRIKQALTLGKKQFHKEFTALKDVSFEIRKGETVGIIGRNGSGKSTLLQLICGVLKPTSGSVKVNGRISALLELGAGFNPEFTGRENVYFQGALAGFTNAQMDERFDDISAFADIGDFMDQPVRTYSSGMFVRLGFSVAINLGPDILIVDEALAVGDSAFQAKCFDRIREIRRTGGTLLFVSHSVEQVLRLCSRAILLDHSLMMLDGTPRLAIEAYRALTFDAAESAAQMKLQLSNIWSPLPTNSQCFEFGSRQVSITAAGIYDKNGEPTLLIRSGQTFSIRYTVHFFGVVSNPVLGFVLRDQQGLELAGTNTYFNGLETGAYVAGDELEVIFKQSLPLRAGNYFVSLNCTGYERGNSVAYHRAHDLFVLLVESDLVCLGLVNPFADIVLHRLPAPS